ncbi:uncharacterized protein LOC108667478 [Hyalella azteca]|uniref:Uncharacterized protein LOC108667478 n=1 Tax=Hyalella azteca TaxID=294128 RepID=A0A8B7N7W9_HYAAZ|nr:uncharacterized protein LOC108667478 [Hyalella azteca]
MVPPNTPASPVVQNMSGLPVPLQGSLAPQSLSSSGKLPDCNHTSPLDLLHITSVAKKLQLVDKPSNSSESPSSKLSTNEQDLNSDSCSEMNRKNNDRSDMNSDPINASNPNRRVRANHRRNLSLDFRAMGIELPPLSEVVPPTNTSAPLQRRLPNIPEHNTPLEITPQPAITPKIKHVVRRIFNRTIN